MANALKTPPRLYAGIPKSVMVGFGVASLIASAGALLGAWEWLGPETTAVCVLTVAAMLVAWWVVGIVLGSSWRAPRRVVALAWLDMLMMAATLATVGYRVGYQPYATFRRLADGGRREQARAVVNRGLFSLVDTRSAFEALAIYGDESSMPYALWALRFGRTEILDEWQLGYAYRTLRFYTNHKVLPNRDDWVRWYARNRHKTQLQWWADGFTAKGYPVSARGDVPSIRSLFRVLYRAPRGAFADDEYLEFNAIRLLRRLRPELLQAAIERVLAEGSSQEQCGLAIFMGDALYYGEEPEALARPLLRRLAQSRLLATDEYARREFDLPDHVLPDLDPPELREYRRFKPPKLIRGDFPPETRPQPPPAPKPRSARTSTHVLRGNRPTEVVFSERGSFPLPTIAMPRPKNALVWPAGFNLALHVDTLPPVPSKAVALTLEGTVAGHPAKSWSTHLVTVGIDDDCMWLHWHYDPRDDCVYVLSKYLLCKIQRATGRIAWETGAGPHAPIFFHEYILHGTETHLLLRRTDDGLPVARLPENLSVADAFRTRNRLFLVEYNQTVHEYELPPP